MNKRTGNWLGWIGIIAAIIGFLFEPFWFSGAAVLLGLIGLASPKKPLNWTSITLGVAAILFGMI